MHSHDEHYPWRIYPCDLDGKGINDLRVGVCKTTGYDNTVERLREENG
ncbi:MAG: hypothetical protein M0Z52_08820 [Actinomycetota bacterium]|nr:hypothetical protein [Actinomycetota bacterium]